MKTIVVLTALLAAGPALADCPPAPAMEAAARAWLAGDRVPDPNVADIAQARCAYAAYLGVLQAEMGKPVGIKVGFRLEDD